jgi:hypothetical protein
MAATPVSIATETVAAVLPTCEKAVANCLTAFWSLVEGAAKAAQATSAPAAFLGAAAAAAALQPVAAVAAAPPAGLLAAVVEERKTLAGPVALAGWAALGMVNRDAMGWFTAAATAARRARVSVTAVSTEAEEAAAVAITAVVAAERAVVLRTMAAMAAVVAEARPTLSRAPRTCASGKGGKSRRITA